MTGPEIRAARERAGLTQEQLGREVGVSLRTIGNWERGATVPQRHMGRLEEVLGQHAGTGGTATAPPLGQATDAELLAEIARRFARGLEREKVVRDDNAAPMTSRASPRTAVDAPPPDEPGPPHGSATPEGPGSSGTARAGGPSGHLLGSRHTPRKQGTRKRTGKHPRTTDDEQ